MNPQDAQSEYNSSEHSSSEFQNSDSDDSPSTSGESAIISIHTIDSDHSSIIFTENYLQEIPIRKSSISFKIDTANNYGSYFCN